MDEEIDLFEHYETLPEIVQTIINGHDHDNPTYKEANKLLKMLIPHGYTFEYGLSGEPYGLTMVSECNVGDKCFITNEEVEEQSLESNHGTVRGFSKDEDIFYAYLTLSNGKNAIVNAKSIKNLF